MIEDFEKKNSYFPTLSRPILSNPILIFVFFFRDHHAEMHGIGNKQ